ncbi:PHB depolymerase family esterase [Alkalimonas delamerensis]|uniref:PHB depolymerase family esterase n=1 Tax=Alkalimonas delamerensis TaxID=265981 RepID=A0ABT9GTJ7_9GAMM|nr:PHB depolymerase family esterase [Alkalimonas delamerensis]MDP4530296.1 PHB depolymerase family esterase [Alkalimonas delamerensis]
MITTLVLLAGLAVGEEVSLKLQLVDNQITVSGLSSGGYMASQFHIAHSSRVVGAGIFSAGPYFCARNNLQLALQECVSQANAELPFEQINQRMASWQHQGLIDPIVSLANSRAWLFHGQLDQRVDSQLTRQLKQQYQQWLPDAQIRLVDDKAVAHLFPTQSAGGSCEVSESPFIGHCQFAAASEMMDFLTAEATAYPEETGQIYQFDQYQLAGQPVRGMAQHGYLFVPEACKAGNTCALHISFHGCNQNAESVGQAYVRQTGFNEWAGQHRTVVLYPQTMATNAPLNPQACWDWWGYTSAAYATKEGEQINAVAQMIEALQRQVTVIRQAP